MLLDNTKKGELTASNHHPGLGRHAFLSQNPHGMGVQLHSQYVRIAHVRLRVARLFRKKGRAQREFRRQRAYLNRCSNEAYRRGKET
jgi:hypothetical protein